MFGALRGQERHQKRRDFVVQAQQLAFSIETHFDLPLELLRSVAALFLSSDTVSRDEFRTFVRPIIERHPSIYAFEWMPLVRHSARDSLVRAVRAEGFTEFDLQQRSPEGDLILSAERPDYLPILYMEPLEPVVLGLDVIGNPERADEAVRARAILGPTASDRYSLIEDPDDVYSIIAYLPVLKPRPDSPDREFLGLVGVLMRLEPVVLEALAAGDSEGIHIAMRDETAAENNRVLFEDSRDTAGLNPEATWTSEFDFADRRYSASFTPLPASAWMPGQGPFVLWVAGLLLGVLAAFGTGAPQGFP